MVGCIDILESSRRVKIAECLSILLNCGPGMGAAVSLKEQHICLKQFVNEMEVCRCAGPLGYFDSEQD